MSNQFSPDETAGFERDGFAIVRQLAPPSLVQHMREVTIDQLVRRVEPLELEADLNYPGAPPSAASQGGKTIRRLKQAHSRDYVFSEWLQYPGLLGRLQQLLGPQIVCPLAHHNCVMTKQPEYSSQTGWHQDIRYWSFTKPHLVNVWLALGSEHPKNGCLQVIPGSHRQAFRPDQFDAQVFFRDDLPENQTLIETRRFVELEPGDVLFFHALTLHAASQNFTNEPKYSAVFTFRGSETHPRAGTRSASHPELWLTPGV